MEDKEMVNISTKEEIEARNKRGKEKDELIQALLHYITAEASGGIKSLIDCEGCAFYLYEILGYRKSSEDGVINTPTTQCETYSKNDMVLISRERYDRLKSLYDEIWNSYYDGENNAKVYYENIKIPQERKEIKEKILNELYMHFSADKLCGIANPNKNYNSAKVVSRLAKSHGIEIKE